MVHLLQNHYCSDVENGEEGSCGEAWDLADDRMPGMSRFKSARTILLKMSALQLQRFSRSEGFNQQLHTQFILRGGASYTVPRCDQKFIR